MVHRGKKAYLKSQKNATAVENSESVKVLKKARIIVRNLPFKNLSEKSVEEFFKEYGDIEEVKLLRKHDGKFLGCGFVQFTKVSSAAKAIRHANQKEMSGRTIVVDWALPKKTFLEKVERQFKENTESQIKTEVLSDEEKQDFVIDKKPSAWKSDEESDQNESDEESNNEVHESGKKMNSSDDDDDDDDGDDDDDDDGDDDTDDLDGGGEDFEANRINSNDRKKPLTDNTQDVEDGKTIFVRNIPFSATNDDLKSCFECYGPVHYALICIDKLTEHSKGTGFVKFKDQESASQCMKESTKIYLHDNPLTVTKALSRTNLEGKRNSKKTIKDSRNLYLIREGIVIAGSKAAAGVSAGDMAKRLQLEQWKSQILKNLNMFVSKTRLVIHNLPPFYDDAKLKNLFMKYSNPKAVIKEAKVMYEKKKLDSSGNGASKEVGFVTFTNHEDALFALRSINNNPEIFTPKKRPIVAFSIENKAVINSKAKRLEKSRAKLGITNDKSDTLSKLNRKQRRFLRRREKFIQLRKEAVKAKQSSSNSEVGNVEKVEIKVNKRKKSEEFRPIKKLRSNESTENGDDAVQNEFTGLMSEPGKKVKLRAKFRLKNQASIHSQTLKAERRKRRERERKKMSLRKPMKEKKGKPKLMDDVNLLKLLKKHRESVQSSSVIKKWYDN